jgi:AbrB family looped-hinge helix DNA binding protein
MTVKLSSKGQLVLPKHVRQELQLQSGAEFEVEIVDGKIVLQPVLKQEELQNILARLRKIVQGADLRAELEAERQEEKKREQKLEQSLRAR